MSHGTGIHDNIDNEYNGDFKEDITKIDASIKTHM